MTDTQTRQQRRAAELRANKQGAIATDEAPAEDDPFELVTVTDEHFPRLVAHREELRRARLERDGFDCVNGTTYRTSRYSLPHEAQEIAS